MIRVNQIRQAGQQYEVPESSASEYYFNAKLVTYGKPNFDSALTGGRVSTAEFTEFRAKIIEAGGSLLNKVRIVFYLRFLVAGFSLIFCALRTTLRYVHGMSLTPTDPYIMMAVLIIPNLIINYIWSKIAGKFTKKVQDAINQENTTTFREKGVTWKISSSLLYFQVTMRNDNTYRPPQHLENVLTSYPIKMQPARPGQQESQQQSSMMERFPGLVLEQRQDNLQYPNAQNQPEIFPLNPNPHPPINSQPLRTVNNNGLYSQASETWDYRS